MDHERNELRKHEREATVTRVYREDPEACAKAVLYALEMRGLAGRSEEGHPSTNRTENFGDLE